MQFGFRELWTKRRTRVRSVWVRRIDSERKSSFDEILGDRLILETFDFRINFFYFETN